MYSLVVVAVCFTLASGAPNNREKRQVLNNCIERPINNPCTTNVLGRVYYPHPTDNAKFLQCGQGGRMFIIQCPSGEVYNQASTTCARPQVVNPVVTPTNPCSAANYNKGLIFFAYSGDSRKFYECNVNGQAQILSCPTRLLWDQARQSCVLKQGSTGTGGVVIGTGGTGGTAVGTGVIIGSGLTNNPCSVRAVNSNQLFFSHPDATKFIQCDLAGDAYVMQCPSGLVWNQYTTTCASPYVVGGNTVITG